jgi:hypothetical protein
MVIFDKKSFQIGSELFSDIEQFIDERYVDLHSDSYEVRARRAQANIDWSRAPMPSCPSRPVQREAPECTEYSVQEVAAKPTSAKRGFTKNISLDHMLDTMDESFSQMLLRKIDESGMTDAQCYKKANIDRKLFSKIKNDPGYKTSKTTVIAFALALELSLEETKDMLMKAGFALSHSNKFDIIIEYFIMKKNYDIFEINEVLFAFDQMLLGV